MSRHSSPFELSQASLPANYAVTSSLQSMLNAPSDDVMAAFDEIERRFHQLPGQGEIVTNVSLGDLDDASAENNPNDPCYSSVQAYGPTTEIVGGQRYINLPSFPLIPTYTSDDNGNLSGTGEVCNVDPADGEIDLDFSMMAPLPHEQQRAGEVGNGGTDLLGIAPGATYRLVAPSDTSATDTVLQAALLAAATQTPRPNVITTSIGFGEDAYGFPGRFLEDDPLLEAIVTSIVQHDHIVVSISSNDGTRTLTNAAIGPSGGSTPTNVVGGGGQATTLDDVTYTSVPSRDYDSGSIDAGGVTLDDIFANPPQYAANGAVQAQHAYAETRWDGFTDFSSGYGSRVDLSAPADNVIAFEHPAGGTDDAVDVVIQGGTSASAPEIAACAAVLQQIARLTGHPFASPSELRSFLVRTGTPVPPVTQADTELNVGPQVDLRRAVETLMKESGARERSSVPRVAVEQRRNFAYYDGVFEGDTDPANIDLQDSYCSPTCFYTALNEYAWISIAPDWEFPPAGAKYTLRVASTNKVLATTPWARLQPETILQAAGFKFVSNATRTVRLRYTMSGAGENLSTTFTLTFGPAPALSDQVFGPEVPPVVTGPTIPVTYDVSHVAHISTPLLMVSMPGRLNDWTGQYYNPVYAVFLSEPKGTIRIPVSKLQGGGVYSIQICLSYGALTRIGEYESDAAITRVAPQPSDKRADAPLLSAAGSLPANVLGIPYDGKFRLSYDVSGVPGATGAALEVSFPSPTTNGSTALYNTFNNPNGSMRDDNGIDSGSIYWEPLAGTRGTIMLDAKTLGLAATMYQQLRIVPMKGDVAAGEASDVDSIMMDGIVPAGGASSGFGGILGFGINANGNDGFLTSNPDAASGEGLGSIQTFDQTTKTITSELPDPAGGFAFTAPFPYSGPGIFGHDVGLFGSLNLTTGAVAYNLLNPVPSASIGAAWNPPAPYAGLAGVSSILGVAANQSSDTIALLGENPTGSAGDQWQVITSQLLTSNAGNAINISQPVNARNYVSPVLPFGLAEDTSSNIVYAPAYDAVNPCITSTIVTVDLAAGSVGSFPGVQPAGTLAIDSSTHMALGNPGPDCPAVLGLYDLAKKSRSPIKPRGAGDDYFLNYVAADATHHVFLAAGYAGTSPPHRPEDHLAQGNNNTLESVFSIDENGVFQKTLTQFNLGDFFIGRAQNLQLHPSTRTGYVPSWNGELAPFTY